MEAFSPSGQLYATAGATAITTPQDLRIIDPTDGSYTDVGALWGDGIHSQGLAFSPGGVLYGVSPHSITGGDYDLFTIDLNDAEMHLIGTHTGDIGQSIAFTPTGDLYAIGGAPGGSQFARLNPATGAVIGTVYTFPGDYRGLALIPEPATVWLLTLGGLAILRRRRA